MNEAIAELPVLGLGASLSLGAAPDPARLVTLEGGPAFVEYAGLADVDAVVEEVARIHDAGAPVLFHPSYINFCGTFENDLAWLEATARHVSLVGSPWFAQDCAYCFWAHGSGYSSQFGWFIPPILSRASLAAAADRIREVQAVVPVPVAIEPPPVSFVVGHMPVFEFFGELAERADCALLLDMGHLVSYEMATGRPVTDALDALPAERVIEVHVAGGEVRNSVSGPTYVDAHEQPVREQTWAMLDRMLPALPNLKAMCFECEGVAEEDVLGTLASLREHIRAGSASVPLTAALDAAP
jgi:uncharacterized protein (UPF0276 family)